MRCRFKADQVDFDGAGKKLPDIRPDGACAVCQRRVAGVEGLHLGHRDRNGARILGASQRGVFLAASQCVPVNDSQGPAVVGAVFIDRAKVVDQERARRVHVLGGRAGSGVPARRQRGHDPAGLVRDVASLQIGYLDRDRPAARVASRRAGQMRGSDRSDFLHHGVEFGQFGAGRGGLEI